MFDRSRETSLNKPIRDKNNSVVASRICVLIDQRILRVRLPQHVQRGMATQVRDYSATGPNCVCLLDQTRAQMHPSVWVLDREKTHNRFL
jgi:hypothetical protein